MNTEIIGLELQSILPEIILAVLGLAMLMIAAFRGDRQGIALTNIALVGVAVALISLRWVAPTDITEVAGRAPSLTSFGGLYAVDDFAGFLKVLILLAVALTLILTVAFLKSEDFTRSEYPVLMVFATLGMLIMVSANNMLMLYIGLEMQSLSLYVLAAIRRDSLKGSEAGLKYFVLGALSSGLLLYGISMIYGFSGTLDFYQIAQVLDGVLAEGQAPPAGLVLGLVFVLAGLAFKVSAVPFHMWTPDVYEGAPTAVTAFFAAAPKVAALGLMARVLTGAFEPAVEQWQDLVVILAGASMILGAIAAIAQTNIKRLMAYSSIGHVGFALMGLAAGTQAGVESVVIYMAIYIFMTLGAFAVILCMRQQGVLVENITDLAGLSQTHRGLAIVMAIFMFSLAGIPPLGGFFAKLYAVRAAVEADLIVLALVGMLASAVGVYYYLRVVKIMFFDPPGEPLDSDIPGPLWSLMGGTALVVLLFILVLGPIVDGATLAASALFPPPG